MRNMPIVPKAQILVLVVVAVMALAVIVQPVTASAKTIRLTTDGCSYTRVGLGWSPDGKHILFAKDRKEKRQLWIMDADGRNARPVSKLGWEHCWGWSPDSKKIVFVYCSDFFPNPPATLYLYDLSTNKSRVLHAGFTRISVGDPSGWGIVQWTKDSKAFIIGMNRTSDPESGIESFLFNAQTGAMKKLTPNHHRTGSMYAGSWSPDSSHLALPSKKSESDNCRVWICARDGSGLHPITPADWQVYGDPRWSPTDDLIVFSSNHGRSDKEKEDDECDLWLVRDGSKMFQLTHGSSPDVNSRMDFGYPEWSADGKYVAAISNRFDEYGNQFSGITLIDVKTGECIPVFENDPKSKTVLKGLELKNTNVPTKWHLAFIAQRFGIGEKETGSPTFDYEEDVLLSFDIKTRKLTEVEHSSAQVGGEALYMQGYYWKPFWSPDDRRLLFVKGKVLDKDPIEYTSDLYLYEP